MSSSDGIRCVCERSHLKWLALVVFLLLALQLGIDLFVSKNLGWTHYFNVASLTVKNSRIGNAVWNHLFGDEEMDSNNLAAQLNNSISKISQMNVRGRKKIVPKNGANLNFDAGKLVNISDEDTVKTGDDSNDRNRTPKLDYVDNSKINEVVSKNEGDTAVEVADGNEKLADNKAADKKTEDIADVKIEKSKMEGNEQTNESKANSNTGPKDKNSDINNSNDMLSKNDSENMTTSQKVESTAQPTTQSTTKKPETTSMVKTTEKPTTQKIEATKTTEKPTTQKVTKTPAKTEKKSEKDESSVNTDAKSEDGELPLCPEMSPNLVGPITAITTLKTYTQLETDFPDLEPGGRWKPKNCKPRHHVAIVIPFRDRDEHLRILLPNLHRILQRQQMHYGIYVIDQALPSRFNRGLLMNVGFTEALKVEDYQCFIFHDVDLLPENDKNLYSCPVQPRHMSVAIDKFGYRLPYSDIFGGISAIKSSQFKDINGFPNMYFGWGGEDDDFSARVRRKGLKLIRPPTQVARYKMIKHGSEKSNPPNPARFAMLKDANSRYDKDGLSNLQYERIGFEQRKLFTWVYVKVSEGYYLNSPLLANHRNYFGSKWFNPKTR